MINITCENCEKVQDLAFDKNVPESAPIAYFRVGVANVAIVACEEHLIEVMDKLRRK